ncbi:hypothetical protein FZEAL_5422 [Fusarium zealandicum]|uniref:Uncharacterized protein n=1 Tax=Fusarium zealandicum TaxID=1053134 RepID=A0A8H4UKN8_9HYPO|nr:hypothetical protein FZEAL_5422 [Fusarium zealandicum]
MASTAYFEVCWSIFSTICLVNCLFGLLVCEITSYSVLAVVPILSSAAGAIANGLCYYVYYQSHPTVNKVVGAVFSDVFWLIQEASMLLYSYMILRRILRGRQWHVFSAVFWILIVLTAITRVLIGIYRVRFILENDKRHEIVINYLHIGYFTFMAISECLSAYFLIAIFASAKDTSLDAALKVGLLRYLTRSTEIRVAFLAILGVARTIIHPFQVAGQRAENVASQLDRFLYALFCLYPVVLYIDTLASKLRYAEQARDRTAYSNCGAPDQQRQIGLSEQTRCFTVRSDHGSGIYEDGGVAEVDRNISHEQMLKRDSSERRLSEIN